jgi:hypothetical protein
MSTISPNHTRVWRAPSLAGRGLTDQDDAQAPPAALVNQALVRQFWNGQNPIMERIWVGRLVDPVQLVGVIGGIKNISLAAEPSKSICLSRS